MNREMHINLFLHGKGHHESAWRHSENSHTHALNDFAYVKDIALRAEKACLDSIFFADILSLSKDITYLAGADNEPLTTVAALAAITDKIGLVATASTTYSEPYNLARVLSSLDHLSKGRVGWNIVTSWAAESAGNFGYDAQPEHAERYIRAHEFMQVITKLWKSWEKDALVQNSSLGIYADYQKIHKVEHVGKYFQVKGALNLPRSPQVYPVLVQAGSSPDGIEFAARFAEAVFTVHMEINSAKDFYRTLKEKVINSGRSASGIVILPGFSPIIGSTEEEAIRLSKELGELSSIESGYIRLSNRFGGYNFRHLNLETTLTKDDFPSVDTIQAARSRAKTIIDYVEKNNPTLRQLMYKLAQSRGHFSMTGTPEQVAETMADWFLNSACDGFNLMPAMFSNQFEIFTTEVIPLLQRKGLFRKEYSTATLREHYGIPSL